MTCKACVERGKPENYRSEPKCAFIHNTFSKENWNCATLNKLREISNQIHGASTTYGDDETLVVIPLYRNTFNFMIIGYYKQRGTVHTLMMIKEGSINVVPNIKTIETIIKSLMPKPWIRKVPKGGYEVTVPAEDEVVFISDEQYWALEDDDAKAIKFAVEWLATRT